MSKALMIDIETFDTHITAEIRSIGAVVFDMYSDPQDFDELLSNSFYANVKYDIEPPQAFTRSDDTLVWWEKQGMAANMAFDTPAPIDWQAALSGLYHWVSKQDTKYVWANSPEFDLSILGNHFQQAGWAIPWKFWDHRDCRTLWHMARMGFPSSRTQPPGFIAHRADHDAAAQAIWCQEAMQKLNIGRAA